MLTGIRHDKEELKMLRLAFAKMDLDGDGSLSYNEIQAAEAELKNFGIKGKWKDILDKCDLDGDGRIDFHEFFTAAIDK